MPRMSQQDFELRSLPTPIGAMRIVTDAAGRLRALDWDDYAPRMHRLLRLHYGPDQVRLRDSAEPTPALESLAAYLAGDLRALDLVEVETGGTPFQRQVWSALRSIPAGSTVSYRELAQRLGRPSAVRAVGLANGANPVGVVVPCHRVIGSGGALTGYGGGLQRKQWLLEHEGVRLSRRV